MTDARTAQDAIRRHLQANMFDGDPGGLVTATVSDLLDETSELAVAALLEWATTDEQIERLCERLHDAYEIAAVNAGWETQARSRKPWAEVPEANKAAMRDAVRAVTAALLGSQQ